MSITLVRSESEVNELLDACTAMEAAGETKYPGMSYEQGVKYALDWVLGNSDEHPMED